MAMRARCDCERSLS